MPRFSLTILPLLLTLILPSISALLPRAPPPFKVAVLPSTDIQQPLYFTSNQGTCTTTKTESPICQIKPNGKLFCGDYTHPLGLDLLAAPGDLLASVLAPCSGACDTAASIRLNPQTLIVEWPGVEFWYLPVTQQIWIAKAGVNLPVEIPVAAVKAQLKALFS